jgi:hypothetical protein
MGSSFAAFRFQFTWGWGNSFQNNNGKYGGNMADVITLVHIISKRGRLENQCRTIV